MSLDFGLRDVHVLITGAAGGIGLELVNTFRQLGARVTAHYNSRIGELADIPDIVSLQADVRDEVSVDILLAQAAEKNGGPVGVLVVNHGIWPEESKQVVDMSLEQWNNTIAVDLTGPFLLCRAYLKGLKTAPDSVKDAANIIFIGSTAGKFGEAGTFIPSRPPFAPLTNDHSSTRPRGLRRLQIRLDVRSHAHSQERNRPHRAAWSRQ